MAFQDRFVDRYLNPIEVEEQLAGLVSRFPEMCRVEELPFLSHGYHGAKVKERIAALYYISYWSKGLIASKDHRTKKSLKNEKPLNN